MLGLASLAGGGLSSSSSATSGPATGSLTGSQTFGGINTGTQSMLPPWAIAVAIGAAALVAVVYLTKRR